MKRWPTIMVCLGTLLILVAAMVGCQAPAPTTPTAAPKPAATTTPTATATPKPTAKAEPIKIGATLSLSGFLADYGVSTRNGIDLAVEEVNKSGGVLGRPLEMVIRDNKSKVDVALSEMKSLYYDQGIKLFFGGIPQTAALAQGDFAKQEKLLVIAIVGGDVTGATGHRYIFKLIGSQSYSIARALAEFAATKHPEWKRYYILVSDYLYPHEGEEYFWERLTALKKDVVDVGRAYPASGTPDYSAYITAIMAAKPDAVYGFLPGVDDVNFIKQARGFGFFDKVKYLGQLVGETSVLAPLGKDSVEGMTVQSGPAFPGYRKDKLFTDFAETYHQKTGSWDTSSGASGYDHVMMTVQAIKKAGSTDVEKVIDALEGLEYNGLNGNIKISPYQHLGMRGGIIGETGPIDPKYGYATMKVLFEYGPDLKYFLTDDEVRKLREKK